jgi:hypothetical protein
MTPIVDRRREGRLRSDAAPDAITARIRPGHVVWIVDVSAHGALIETGRRLIPGSRIDVHLERCDRQDVLKAAVVRSYVATLRPNVVVFRCALNFERPSPLIASD